MYVNHTGQVGGHFPDRSCSTSMNPMPSHIPSLSPGHAVWTGLYQSALACCSAYSFLPQHQRRSAMHSQRCTRCTSFAWVHRDSSYLPCHLSRVCKNLSLSCFFFFFLNPVRLSWWLLCCGLTWWWLKFSKSEQPAVARSSLDGLILLSLPPESLRWQYYFPLLWRDLNQFNDQWSEANVLQQSTQWMHRQYTNM